MGKTRAEKHGLEEAKRWVDARLLKGNLVNGLDMGAIKT